MRRLDEPFSKTDLRPGRSRLVVDAILAGLTPNAEQRRGLATGINEVFAAFEKSARKNNVAYALAFMIAASLGVQTGTAVTDDSPRHLPSRSTTRSRGRRAS